MHNPVSSIYIHTNLAVYTWVIRTNLAIYTQVIHTNLAVYTWVIRTNLTTPDTLWVSQKQVVDQDTGRGEPQ
jgi:hypothetical protein